jgi:hypothetical protein
MRAFEVVGDPLTLFLSPRGEGTPELSLFAMGEAAINSLCVHEEGRSCPLSPWGEGWGEGVLKP